MIVLGIETSCDETAVSILKLGKRQAAPVKILANLIASQHEIHLPYGGVFPELASRRHIEVLRPLVEEVLKKAGIAQNKLDGVAVTYAPGLVGSLLVGISFAKAYAYGLGVPFIGVHHLEGHLNAPSLENSKIPYPRIGLVVSGGHTAIYLVKQFGGYRLLGSTKDDASGEAFDKVAKILGLRYPGGPEIDRISKTGNPAAIRFPKPKMSGYNFSFSGLKTAVKQLMAVSDLPLAPVRPLWPPNTGPSPPTSGGVPLAKEGVGGGLAVPDVCASFQETVVDYLIEKTFRAARAHRCRTIVVTGGVACNSRLRTKMTEAAKESRRKVFFASPVYCTDNAAMIAYVGGRRLFKGERSPLSLNAVANLALPPHPNPLPQGERVST